MVIMGKRDRLFPWQDGERLVNEARGEAKFVLLAEGNTAVPTSSTTIDRLVPTGWPCTWSRLEPRVAVTSNTGN